MTPVLDITVCVKKAAKAFKGWWIPLCLVSGVILFSQTWIPHWLLGQHVSDLKPYLTAYEECKSKCFEEPTRIADHVIDFEFEIYELSQDPGIQSAIKEIFIKLFTVIFILFFVVLFLNLLLILLAKASTQVKKERTLKKNMRNSPFLFLSYTILSIVKIAPWFFCVLPGVYLYVRLFFTGFIITEESSSPFTAMRKSWKMTEGNFGRLCVIFLIAFAIDIFSLMTIIAFIPGTSFKYTLRAAAYQQLRGIIDEKDENKEKSVA